MFAPEPFRGWLGQWVRSLEPFTEADPVALLTLALGALGHCVRDAVRVPDGQPANQLIVLVGDERARVGQAWKRVERLFTGVLAQGWLEERKSFLCLPQPLPTKEWPQWALRWDQGLASLLVQSRPEEVLARLAKPEAIWSGFAPRTLLLRVRGERLRPLGEAEGGPEVFLAAANGLADSLSFAKNPIHAQNRLAPKAEVLWREMYLALRQSRNAGTTIDNMTELAERHVLRLAGLYAVVDQSPLITPEHLLAALALWDHAEATLYELFANQTGDKKRDDVLRSLRERHPAGMTTDEVNRAILKGNRHGGAGKFPAELEETGLIYSQEEPARGRGKKPAHRWFLASEVISGVQPRSYLGIAKNLLAEQRVQRDEVLIDV